MTRIVGQIYKSMKMNNNQRLFCFECLTFFRFFQRINFSMYLRSFVFAVLLYCILSLFSSFFIRRGSFRTDSIELKRDKIMLFECQYRSIEREIISALCSSFDNRREKSTTKAKLKSKAMRILI